MRLEFFIRLLVHLCLQGFGGSSLVYSTEESKIGRQTTTQWQWFFFQSFFLLLLAQCITAFCTWHNMTIWPATDIPNSRRCWHWCLQDDIIGISLCADNDSLGDIRGKRGGRRGKDRCIVGERLDTGCCVSEWHTLCWWMPVAFLDFPNWEETTFCLCHWLGLKARRHPYFTPNPKHEFKYYKMCLSHSPRVAKQRPKFPKSTRLILDLFSCP